MSKLYILGGSSSKAKKQHIYNSLKIQFTK